MRTGGPASAFLSAAFHRGRSADSIERQSGMLLSRFFALPGARRRSLDAKFCSMSGLEEGRKKAPD
jgi:hypothetical protein